MNIISIFILLAAIALLALGGLRAYSIAEYNRRLKQQHKRSRGQAPRRRPRPRNLDGMTLVMLCAGVILLIAALLTWGKPEEPVETEPSTEATQETETQAEEVQNPDTPGWHEEGGLRYYLLPDGTRLTGWQEIDGKYYYFHDDGTMRIGWLHEDGVDYYLQPDGTMARGQVEIGGKNYFFTSSGANIQLVNPWNAVPDDYVPDLVSLSSDYGVENSQVDRSCLNALITMLDDCKAEVGQAYVLSAYRSYNHQSQTFQRKVNEYISQGYTQADAEREAATIIARPGTSEHHLGLAVDIVDTTLWALEEEQENLPAQRWLMDNSWRYGFILRYPKDKIDITGIIYEPWHYRYVGEEVAAEIHQSGLTLEEYIASLN